MAKPSVNLVKDWTLAYDSDLIKVEAGTAEFHHDYWRITNKATGKKKYFYGELAWQNAHREASDLDWGFLESARG
jgi:hypothetical protein